MLPEENTYCHYSDLPSPMAYVPAEEKTGELKKEALLEILPTNDAMNAEEINKPSLPKT